MRQRRDRICRHSQRRARRPLADQATLTPALRQRSRDRLDQLANRLSVLCDDDRCLCQTPLQLVTEINRQLNDVEKRLAIATSAVELRDIDSRLNFADGLIFALENGVYPLIGRWREADNKLFEAVDSLLENAFRRLTSKGKGKLADTLRSAFHEAKRIGENRPRVALEMLAVIINATRG